MQWIMHRLCIYEVLDKHESLLLEVPSLLHESCLWWLQPWIVYSIVFAMDFVSFYTVVLAPHCHNYWNVTFSVNWQCHDGPQLYGLCTPMILTQSLEVGKPVKLLNVDNRDLLKSLDTLPWTGSDIYFLTMFVSGKPVTTLAFSSAGIQSIPSTAWHFWVWTFY